MIYIYRLPVCHLGKSPTTKLDGYCLVINELYGVVWPCPRMPVTTRIDSDIFWFGSGIPKNTKNTSLGAVTGTGGHTQWIFNYMNCWFFNGVNVRNKNPYMDPMPKNESFGGFKVDHGINDCWVMFNHLLLVMFTHLFYTPEKKKETNDRNLKTMVLEFWRLFCQLRGLFGVYVCFGWCTYLLCTIPTSKGGCQKPYLFTR